MTEHSERVREIVTEALLRPPSERADLLDERCDGDEALQKRVESLIALEADTTSFLDTPAVMQAPLDAFAIGDGPRLPRIEGFEIKRLIATGGMGAVYEAEQLHPRRRVALKLMRPGFLTRTALRRFELEVQVLARLQHPGIAQIFGADVFDDGTGGVPYFVMEYVSDAVTITEFARDHGLGIRARLELFLGVCDAIEHGHQRGVIHRDLKPANILVNSTGQPKVIDFGVARATDADVTLTTLQTDPGQLVGTLAYMSPEQCAADPEAIDTRSDVYALTVVLYELLCGQLPYEVASRPLTDVAHVIRLEPPTRPGTRSPDLRGDLETIMLKGLEKDADDRYQSVGQLAGDVRHYLHSEPITARPPSVTHQLRLFARRHRAAVLALGVVMTTLLVAAIVSSWFAVTATRAAEAEAEQREVAEDVTSFLGRILTRADPRVAQGEEITVREALDQASATIEDELADRPVAEASIRSVIGETYRSIGRLQDAEPHLRRSLALRRKHLGDRDPDTLDTMNMLALLLQAQGRLDDASVLYLEALGGFRSLLGDEDPKTLMLSNNLGWLYIGQRRLEEAEPILRRTLEGRLRVSGENNLETMRTRINLANVLRDLNRLDEADVLYVQAMEAMPRTRELDPGFAGWAMDMIAAYFERRGDLDRAETLAREAVEVAEQIHGEDSHNLYYPTHTLANILSTLGRHDEAGVMYLRTFEGRWKTLGANHGETQRAAGSALSFYHRTERHDDGIAFARRLERQLNEALGPEHEVTLDVRNQLAVFLRQQGEHDEAEAILRELLAIHRRAHDEDHPRLLIVRSNLAINLYAMGRIDEAMAIHRDVLARRRRVLGDDHLFTVNSLWSVALHHASQEEWAEAEPLQREAVKSAARIWDEENIRLHQFRQQFGWTLLHVGKYAESETWLLDSLDAFRRVAGEAHGNVEWAMKYLIELYDTWGKPDQAERWRAAHATWRETHGPAVAVD